MEKYLLIDTCILKQLVSGNQYGLHLKWLRERIEKKEFTLLASKELLAEWKKHREEEIARVKKVVTNQCDKFFKEGLIAAQLDKDYAERLLMSQILDIDQLLARAIQIDESPAVHSVIIEQQKNKYYPFHDLFAGRIL